MGIRTRKGNPLSSMSRGSLLCWLSRVRREYSTGKSITTDYSSETSENVSKLLVHLQSKDKYVCYCSSAALRSILQIIPPNSIPGEVIGSLLPSDCSELETLNGQLKLEVVISVISTLRARRQIQGKTVREDLKVTGYLLGSVWKAILDCWVRVIGSASKSTQAIVPVLNFTKSIWKCDSGRLECRQTIVDHYSELTRLCAHCTSNLQLKKLFRVCFHILSALDSEREKERCSHELVVATLKDILSVDLVVLRFSKWLDSCLVCAGKELTLVSPQRDCTDNELLSAFLRSLLILALRCMVIISSQKAFQLEKELYSLFGFVCDKFRKVSLEWFDKSAFMSSMSFDLDRILLQLISDNDKSLLTTLFLCTRLYRNGNEILSHFPPSCTHFLSACCPHKLFLSFMKSVSFDATMLMEFIASGDREFLLFFTHYLEYTLTSWEQVVAVCGRFDAASDVSSESDVQTESDLEHDLKVGMGLEDIGGSPPPKDETSSKRMCLEDLSTQPVTESNLASQSTSDEGTSSEPIEASSWELSEDDTFAEEDTICQGQGSNLAMYNRCLLQLRLKLGRMCERGLIEESFRQCCDLIDEIHQRHFVAK